MAVVEWLYGESINFLAALEATATIVEAVNNFLATIPGAGTLYDLAGFDNLVGIMTNLGETGRAAVEGVYDVTLQRDMACELFCTITQIDGEFTKDKLNNSAIVWYNANPLNPARYAISEMAQWYVNIGFRFPSREYALNLNNPDPDWLVLCTDCNEPDECDPADGLGLNDLANGCLAQWSPVSPTPENGLTSSSSFVGGTGWTNATTTTAGQNANAWIPFPHTGNYNVTVRGVLPVGETLQFFGVIQRPIGTSGNFAPLGNNNVTYNNGTFEITSSFNIASPIDIGFTSTLFENETGVSVNYVEIVEV
jgi:hypothetical protein